MATCAIENVPESFKLAGSSSIIRRVVFGRRELAKDKFGETSNIGIDPSGNKFFNARRAAEGRGTGEGSRVGKQN